MEQLEQKYIGFDCDECLAQVTQLMPFTEDIQDTSPEVLDRFAQLILENNIPFIRPTFWPLLKEIAANSQQPIPFIYSNNGSLPTLNFIAKLVSMRLGKPDFFKAIAHYYHPARTDNTRNQYIKKWPSVKKFLETSFGVSDIQPHQVMFFDDLPHLPLKGPLGPSYQQVDPFYLPCDIDEITYKVDNNSLVRLWKEAGGQGGEPEESEEGGSLDSKEDDKFVEAFHRFIGDDWKVSGGGRRKRLLTRRKRRRSLSTRTKAIGTTVTLW